jgi:hypothetical protein
MFLANESFRSPIAPLFYGPEYSGWDAMDLSLHSEWYLASLDQFEGQGKHKTSVRRTVLICSFSSLESLITQDTKNSFKLESIHIVTPGHLNHTKTWALEHIRAIWEAQSPHDEQHSLHIIETMNGHQYAVPHVGVTAEAVKLGQLIYQFTS